MKKFLSIILALLMVMSLFTITGMSEGQKNAASDKKSVTFDFSEPYAEAFVPNETSAVDSQGNTFYPLHSASKESSVSYEKIDVTTAQGQQTVDSLQIVAAGHTMFIPVDKDGKPFELSPNSEYEVTVKTFVKAITRYGQLFFGGGALGAYRKDYTAVPSGKFIGTNMCVEAEMGAQHPIYRTSSQAYQDWGGNYYANAQSNGKLRYFEDFNAVTNKYQYYENTLSFATGDYVPTEKGFKLSTGGTEYSFGNYFCIKADGGTINAYTDGVLMHTALEQYNIIELTVTRISGEDVEIPDAPVGNYYSFDFSEGGMPEIKVNDTGLQDSLGNTYYPLHSAKGETTAELVKINASTAMGEEEIDTLELKAYGHTLFIPTDKDGKPYELDPNSAYEVKAKFFVKAADTYSQVFFGGGAYGAYTKAYQLSESKFTASDRWNEATMSARYPIYRSASLGYQDWGGNYKNSTGSRTVRYFDTFDSVNNKFHYYEGTECFVTGDYEKLSRGFSLTNSEGKATFGNYFTVMTDGGNVEVYKDGVLYATNPVQFNFVELKITKLSENAVITFDADDGAFSDGSKTKDYSVVVGNGVYIPEIPQKDGYTLKGWSLTKGGEVISDAATKDLHKKTVYAVYENDEFSGYDRFSRYVDFSNYYVKLGINCTRYDNSTYTASSDPYMSLVNDETAVGGKYLRFGCESTVTEALPNFNITVTPTGDVSDSKTSEENLVLVNNTTYRIKMRYRANTVSGSGKLTLYATYGRNYQKVTDKAEQGYTVLDSNITKTEGWQEAEYYFTTPESYYNDGSYDYNKLFIGLRAEKGARTAYDIDYISIDKVSRVSLYGVEDGVASLQNDYYAQPGDSIELPEFISNEVYNNENSKGNVNKTAFEGWYSDITLKNEVKDLKVENEDTILYGKMSDAVLSSSLNQDIFCGFDTYFNEGSYVFANGFGCAVTNETAYTGSYSMKVTLNKDTDKKFRTFEVKNANSATLYNNTTYRVDFVYKADADVTAQFCVGESGYANVNNYGISELKLAKADNWKTVTAYVTADLSEEDYNFLGFTPAITLSAENDATVYVDTIQVSSLVKNLGVSRLNGIEAEKTGKQALRFYMAYETEMPNDSITVADNTLSVAERGILFKDSATSTEMVIENKGNGVVAAVRSSDFDKAWDHNGVTNAVTFSAYVNGFQIDDTRAITARGYVKLSDGSVYYGEEMSVSVNDIQEGIDYTDLSKLDIVSGELTHTSATEYSIKANNGIVSMKDAYIFLPQGSTIKAKNGVKIYPYNEYLETDENVLNPEYVKEYTFSEGQTVRLVIKGSIDDIEIKVPTDVVKYLLSGNNEFMTYGAEMDFIKESVQNKNGTNYIFISDIHYEGWASADKKLPLFRQMNAIVKMANENEIDFVAVGGDIITGVCSTADSAIEDINEILEPLKNCDKPVFVMMGNHDDNCYHIFGGDQVYYPERIISKKMFTEQVIQVYNKNLVHDSKNPDSRYYYSDLENKKTRVVVLDSIDYDYVENPDGSIKELVNFTDGWNKVQLGSGSSYWGYSVEQLKWLVDEALTAPDGYNYIFLSHMGIDADTNQTWGKPVMYGKELREIISAYQNKTVYNNEKIGKADYTKTNGRILAYNFGHTHIELVLYSSDINLYQISTATPNIVNYSKTLSLDGTSTNNKSHDWRFYRRAYNTINEACFDIVCADEKGVYKYAFGAGGDYKGIY